MTEAQDKARAENYALYLLKGMRGNLSPIMSTHAVSRETIAELNRLILQACEEIKATQEARRG